MNIRAAIVIGVFAAAVALAVCPRADSLGYGFTDPPYNYSDEYRVGGIIQLIAREAAARRRGCQRGRSDAGAGRLAAPENCGAIATSMANFCRVTFDGPGNGKQ